METWAEKDEKIKKTCYENGVSGRDTSLKGIGVEKNANLEDLGVMK